MIKSRHSKNVYLQSFILFGSIDWMTFKIRKYQTKTLKGIESKNEIDWLIFSFFFLFARYSFGFCNCTVSSPSQCKNRQKIFWKCERSSDLLSNKHRPYLSFVKLQLTLRRGPKVISRRHSFVPTPLFFSLHYNTK